MKTYCDLCDKYKKCTKGKDGLWVCINCSDKYPIKVDK